MTLASAGAQTVQPAGPPSRRQPPSRRRAVVRIVVAITAPMVSAVVLVSVFGLAGVRNDSMAPTLSAGDTVLYDRITAPGRGDIVLFADRHGWSPEPGAVLVKRVVGVAGDVVVCCEAGSGRLLVNGVPVDEPFADAGPDGRTPFRVSVPPGTVFVLGDNREESVDSRASLHDPEGGAVRVEDVRGVARLW